MSINSVFRRLLALQETRVLGVEFFVAAMMICVDVAPRRRNPTCSRCGRRYSVGSYDSDSRLWRHVDLGPWELYLRYRIRRFLCPHCKTVVTEAVPWAEFASTFTRDFEDVTSFLAQQANQTVVGRTMKVAWPTVGNIVRRTVNRCGLPLRAAKLYRIGVDEISYRKHHKYLSIVADHDTGHVVWAGKGKSGDSLDPFLDSLGEEGRRAIRLVSMDMSQAYISKVRERLPLAIIVFDPFHVVKLANDAVDKVRRQQVRALKDKAEATALKKTRWVLLKTPEDLQPWEVEKLSVLAKVNRPLYRAYLLKEALRAVFREPPAKAEKRLDAWLAWASRSRLPSFVTLGRTIRQHKAGILAAIEHGLSNGRLEGLNNKIRLISHRAYGFHSAEALIALVMLCCSGIDIPLPSDQRPGSDPYAIM
ncbi:MAG: ISL3 family transposase [Nitrospirae bacterium]|nr:ISL3 family transposase [Nitrospirota bacterium]